MLTDLIVAPLADAAAVARTNLKKRPWLWADAKRLETLDLAALQCHFEGNDPNQPATPEEWVTNPFTRKRVIVTNLDRCHQRFELAAELGEVIVLRIPPVLVHKLSEIDSPEVKAEVERVLRDSPTGNAAAYLDTLLAMAKTASQHRQELFVWMCP